jgi:ABC-type branched-subunit amino acid transport system substrate-binding protein
MRTTGSGRYVRLVAVVCAAGMGVSACGSSDGSGASEGNAASGKPIKVFSVGPYTSGATAAYDEARTAALAAVESINAAGGVNGRKIELETCDDKLTPAGAQTCFQKAASDEDVVAVVGGYNIFPEAVAPIANQAKLSIVGGMGSGDAGLKNQAFFPQFAGTPNMYYVAGAHAAQNAAKRAVVYTVDLPGAVPLTEAVTAGVKENGSEMVGVVKLSAAEPNTAATSAKALALKPDAVVFALSPLQTVSAIKDLRRAGYTSPIYVQTTIFNSTNMKTLAPFDNLVGFQASPPFTDTSVPGVVAYRKAIAKYQPKAVLSEVGEATWLGFDVFKQVAAKLGNDFTRERFDAALKQTSQLDTQGMTADVPGWYTRKPPYSAHPRIVNNHAVITTVTDGKLGWDKTWYPAYGGGDKQPAA